jgi:hypothetical protein
MVELFEKILYNRMINIQRMVTKMFTDIDLTKHIEEPSIVHKKEQENTKSVEDVKIIPKSVKEVSPKVETPSSGVSAKRRSLPIADTVSLIYETQYE